MWFGSLPHAPAQLYELVLLFVDYVIVSAMPQIEHLYGNIINRSTKAFTSVSQLIHWGKYGIGNAAFVRMRVLCHDEDRTKDGVWRTSVAFGTDTTTFIVITNDLHLFLVDNFKSTGLNTYESKVRTLEHNI